MKTKCHYNGPEFVPCDKLLAKCRRNDTNIYNFIDLWISYGHHECPECGASLKKPEEFKGKTFSLEGLE